jgi:hypothetical protein
MSSPSNLYAEKIFSEHPIAFWALDDQVDYVSIISEEDRLIDTWGDPGINPRSGIVGGTASSDYGTIDSAPFFDSAVTMLTGELTSDPFGTIECISYDSLNTDGVLLSDLNQDLSTFSIGTYIYTDSEYLSKIELGYEYFDAVSGENVQLLKSFNTSVSGRWIFISETFENPNQDANIRIVLRVTYSGGADSTDKYKFYVNGLSLGQWSEEFNSTSLGATITSVPNGPLSSLPAIEAKSYGLQNLSGYYLLTETNTLAAKNSGIPMVYGASNVTILSPNGDLPSLIIPGDGFLNEYGKYKQYTIEFWLRLSCDSKTEKRIFGPISGTDGLYVRGPFIIFKIGSSVGTYYVGEWLRPMLIDIRYTSDSASLLINSEEVIKLTFDQETITFPSKTSNGINQDWLAFYAHDDVSPIELDCVAIYPYQVSQILAKRRWVYGQGVEFPENINAAYSGTSTFIDYAFANYSNSYSYPDLGNWDQGIIENLVVENNTLSVPEYNLPKILFNDKTKDEWISALGQIQNEDYGIMSMKPNNDWAGTNGYLLIDNINIMNGNTKGFFGVFKNTYTTNYKEVLFQIKDTATSDYLQISLQNNEIIYTFRYGDEIEDIYTSNAQDIGQEFSIGIKFDDFAEYFGGNLPAFFGKKSSLELYVGGNDNFENSFHGNIYSVGLCTERNLSKISQYFNVKGLAIDNADIFGIDGGIPGTQYWIDIYDGQLPSTTKWDKILNPESNHLSPQEVSTQSFIDFTASYTLRLNQYFGNYDIGIAADSYWEDYIPLTSMAKYVKDADDFSHYDLDFIQFNVNYPAPNTFVQQDATSSWKYSDLQEKFEVPVRRSYESLDNQLFTGYDNYTDLANKTFKSYKYDTSNSIVKTYISFQYLSSGANARTSYFVNTVSPDKYGIVVPGSYIVDYDTSNNPIYDSFENTRYEVIDNMIIYPPKNADFNELALVTHMEITAPDISHNPVKIRSLQYASQAFNDTTPNAVGTRFGTYIYPYKKSGVYYDYKSVNPFSIYKCSSPYLYLTKNSGIQLRGAYDPLINRGLQIPVNEAKDPTHKMIALQMAVRYNEDFFPYAPTEIFQIESKKATIKVFLVANHKDGKRAKMYAINSKTGRIENGIAFYWNGKIVKEPNVSIKEWGMLGISFSNSLSFENYSGSIKITGPILVNTISHYKSTNLQEVQQTTNRPWFKVRSLGSLDFDWSFWDTSYLWNGVLVLSATSYYGVSPEDIYKTYTGTNKIIVDDDRVFTLKSYEYRLLDDVVWQSSVSNAV